MTDQKTANRAPEFLVALNRSLDGEGFVSPLSTLPAEEGSTLGQRRTRPGKEDPFGSLALLEDASGVLRWSDVTAHTAPLPGRRSERPLAGGKILQLRKFEPLAPSRLTGFLEDLDRRLNPHLNDSDSRVSEFTPTGLVPVSEVGGDGRVLLIIHGTFSSSTPYFSQPPDSPWMTYLSSCRNRYSRVLAFDHPTLAAAPFLNAMALHRHFSRFRGDIDIVCHSRGGLVSRWWLEGLRPQNLGTARVVFVGSPLTGTSLASPARLRGALNLLTNLARSLCLVADLASLASPLFLVVSGLLRLVASLGPLSEKLPFLDAGVALVPGLHSQARVGNNLELGCLSRQAPAPATYHAITSNFESDDPLWAFWKPFRLADNLAGHVFDGDNDLVVDTAAMTLDGLARPIPPERRLDFGTNGRVHHTNYFHQKAAVDFLASALS